MSLRLEAILFNHDPASATADAFNIRKNEHERIETPEWRRGVSTKPEDSPAAYARHETEGQTLTIHASFNFESSGPQEVTICALDANLRREPLNGPDLSPEEVSLFENMQIRSDGNVLGQTKPVTVTLNPGENLQSFDLDAVRISDLGVGVDPIVWRWQYRLSGTEDWIDFAITTHRIYHVLNVPTRPWLQDTDETQFPWTDVLDFACDWARGAENTDDAAERITVRVNQLGDQRLLCYGTGSAYYTDENAFDCSSFLALLNNETGKGDSVNCDDCAVIVSTFANSVGCNLTQMVIDVVAEDRNDFGLKPHRRIGRAGEDTGTFGYHMVAAEGCGDNAEVFDACLQVRDPGQPSIFSAPANLIFSDGKGGYLFRLVVEADQEITHAQPDCKRRRLGLALGKSQVRAFRPALEKRFGFNSWKESIAPGTRVFLSEFFFAQYITSSLELTTLQESGPKALARSIHSVWTSATYGGAEPFRIDLYEMESWRDAREGVMKILAAAAEPTLNPPEFRVGDVTFADEKSESILFATGNLVFYLRNLCSKFGSLLDVARDLDQKTLSPPPGTIDPLFAPDAVKRFSFASGDGLVNTKIRIREEPANSFAPRRLYQFRSETGEVSRDNGQLMYQPYTPGNHELHIFAADEEGNVVQQTLQLYVHG